MKLSVLDFGPPGMATAYARHAERLNCSRYWVGEHHTPQQSGSPILLAGIIASATTRIRIGSAGVCLPLYSSFKVAEDARLLEVCFPRRIDLGFVAGLPLAPALADALTPFRLEGPSRAVFEVRSHELVQYLRGSLPPGHPMQGMPPGPLGPNNAELAPDLWLLGTSAHSARMAADLGVNFCYSLHHCGPDGDAAEACGEFRRSATRAGRCAIVVSGFSARHQRSALALAERYPRARGTLPWPLVGSHDQCAKQLVDLAARARIDEIVVLDGHGFRLNESKALVLKARKAMLGGLAQALGIAPRAAAKQ